MAITEFVFKNPRYVGDASTGGARVPNPKLFGWDLGLILGDQASRPVFGILCVAVAAVLGVAVANLRRSASGRRILAARSNERAARAIGVDVGRVKLQVYAASVVHRRHRRMSDRVPVRQRVRRVVRRRSRR